MPTQLGCYALEEFPCCGKGVSKHPLVLDLPTIGYSKSCRFWIYGQQYFFYFFFWLLYQTTSPSINQQPTTPPEIKQS